MSPQVMLKLALELKMARSAVSILYIIGDHTITINILYRTSTYRRYNYLRVDLHLSNMMIDVDGSPTGYVAWYNHHTEASRIRPLRTALKNDKFGVQRMEMLAIYLALADNYIHFRRIGSKNMKKGRRLIVRIRSDSKSTVDQLKGQLKAKNLYCNKKVMCRNDSTLQ
jgi:hypothetical protein